jgi:hypothetical protein
MQDLLVRDGLRHFDGEDEAIGRSRFPIADSASRRTSIKRGVHFDGMEVLGVERQIINRRIPFG